MRSLGRILVVVAGLLGLARSADASPILLGQTVEMTYRHPTISNVIATNTVVVGPGVEWQGYLGLVSVDASDTNIRFTFQTTNAWANVAFSGFGFFDVFGTIPSFGSVVLNSTNMAGFAQSNISFDTDHIFVNWAGLSFTPETFVSLDITAADAPPAVPEPATWTLLGAGLAIVAGVARYRIRVARCPAPVACRRR